jgi:cytochrome c biogenesis protein CcmG/thiol:disulfide interchange protein DsbE
MKKILAIIPLIVFALLVLALIAAMRHSGAGTNKFALHIDELVPRTEVPILDHPDVHFKTEDWSGRAYVVNFFASWCIECKAEHDELLKLALDNVRIIGIDFKDTPDAVRAYLAAAGNPFLAVGQDGSGRTGIDWGITGVPETFLVDGNGKILFHYVGSLTGKIVDERLMPLWRSVQE